jgi:hypothetical protein
VTLGSLTSRADLIVLAETTAIEKRKTGRDHDWNSAEAVLKVLERWHGPAVSEVRVPFPATLACPAPPRFVEGEMVLAFLEKGESGSWGVIGLSYGTLYPHFDELEDWRAAVASFRALSPSGEPSPDARRRWLVETAARRATRWHGVYELSPSADRMHEYYDRTERPALELTTGEKYTLARGIVGEPSFDTNLVAILDLLRGHPDPRVDAVAVAATDAAIALDEPPYFLDTLVVLTLERLGRKVVLPKRENPEGVFDDPLIVGVPSETDWAKGQWIAERPTITVDKTGVVFRSPRPPRVRGTGSETPP